MAFGVGHTLFGIRPDIAIRDEGAGSTQPGSSAKKTSRHIAARRGSLVEARNRMREATLCGPTSAMKKSCEDSLVGRYRAAMQSAIGCDGVSSHSAA
jgi:hypothetical protein